MDAQQAAEKEYPIMSKDRYPKHFTESYEEYKSNILKLRSAFLAGVSYKEKEMFEFSDWIGNQSTYICKTFSHWTHYLTNEELTTQQLHALFIEYKNKGK